MPVDTQYLLNRLEQLGFKTNTVEHPPLRTVEESKQLRGELPGAHVKNLFLKDKFKRFWLVVAQEDTSINLKQLASILGAGKFSFASAAELYEYLGITPGAVSPLALINDCEKKVALVLDQRMMSTSPLNFHPLRNDMTIAISTTDFLEFLKDVEHAPQVINIAQQAAVDDEAAALSEHR